eukprot:8084627-Pyramimonas_sp.AAC.1
MSRLAGAASSLGDGPSSLPRRFFGIATAGRSIERVRLRVQLRGQPCFSFLQHVEASACRGSDRRNERIA